MTEVTDELVENLAKLSRIALDKHDRKVLFVDMKKVIHFVELLDEVQINENDEFHTHVAKGHTHQLREDEVHDILPRDLFLKNAPDQIGGLIKTPPIIVKD